MLKIIIGSFVILQMNKKIIIYRSKNINYKAFLYLINTPLNRQ